jgi:hypothetical protein
MIHRNLRILMLLLVLFGVAVGTFAERWWVRGWSRPLVVDIYPLAADAASAAFVSRLKPEDFQEIAAYIAAEGQRVRMKATPAPLLQLKPPVSQAPPLEPVGNAWQAVRQSLRLRWYAYRQTPFWASLGHVRVFVLYHELRHNEALPASHGLQKGLIGIANIFAATEQRSQNNIVIAHELLHTLGAKDKYDAAGNPIYPEGFGDFTATPRYPQQKAEIMAGRVAISATKSEMPQRLDDTVIGYATAVEIGWK